MTTKLAPGKLGLASIGAGFKIVAHSNGLLPFVGTRLTPFFRGYLINRRWGVYQPVPYAYSYTGLQVAEIYLADVVTNESLHIVDYEDPPGHEGQPRVSYEKLNWYDEY